MEDTNTTPAALTAALTLPEHVTSLATSGVIVTLRQTCITFTKQDAKVAKKVSDDGNAKELVGGFTHELFGKGKDKEPALRALLNHRQTMYNWAKARLFAWGKGDHYCPVAILPAVIKEFGELEAQHTALKKAWGDAYDDAIARRAFMRGTYFSRGDYMSRDAMLDYFTISMAVSEVPVGDFRNAVAADTARDLFTSLSQQHERRMKEIAKQQGERMLEVLESLSHCCELVTERDAEGNLVTKRRKLYTSTVEKALRLCEMYEKFDFTMSAELQKARIGLAQALEGVDVEKLKESDTMRIVIKEQVDDLLTMFRPSLIDDDMGVEE